MRSIKRIKRDIVVERLGRGHDFDEVGRKRHDSLVDSIEVLGGLEVMMADDQSHASLAELLQLALLHRSGGLEFHIDDVKARCSGL